MIGWSKCSRRGGPGDLEDKPSREMAGRRNRNGKVSCRSQRSRNGKVQRFAIPAGKRGFELEPSFIQQIHKKSTSGLLRSNCSINSTTGHRPAGNRNLSLSRQATLQSFGGQAICAYDPLKSFVFSPGRNFLWYPVCKLAHRYFCGRQRLRICHPQAIKSSPLCALLRSRPRGR